GKPADKIDYAKLAKKTEGFSGADLMSVVDIAIEAKLREAMAKGAPSAITTKSLLTSIKDVRPSTREWFNTARNYLLYANQSGIYDAIRDYLER
ncbi:MAG TPA: cell division protein, partial [Calditrichia bacterium]|nr:cell division protein [Calditrichia bacterium]